MTKLAPARIVSLMMGVWFLARRSAISSAARPRRSTNRCRCRRCSTPSRSCRWCCGLADVDLPAKRLTAMQGGLVVARDSWRSTTTSASATSRSRLSRQATPRRAKRARQGQAALLLRAEAPRQPSALRLPARARRRAAVLGRAQGPVARSEDQAAGDARRGSPDRVRHVRRRDPRRATAPASSCSGTQGTWTPESRRRRQGAREGRPEVHARRLQAEGIVGARAHARLRRRAAATAGAGC